MTKANLYCVEWTPHDEEESKRLANPSAALIVDVVDIQIHFRRANTELARRQVVIEALEAHIAEQKHRYLMLAEKQQDSVALENIKLREQVKDLSLVLRDFRKAEMPDFDDLDPKWEDEDQTGHGGEAFGDDAQAVYGGGPGTPACCIPFDQFFLLMMKQIAKRMQERGNKTEEDNE